VSRRSEERCATISFHPLALSSWTRGKRGNRGNESPSLSLSLSLLIVPRAVNSQSHRRSSTSFALLLRRRFFAFFLWVSVKVTGKSLAAAAGFVTPRRNRAMRFRSSRARARATESRRPSRRSRKRIDQCDRLRRSPYLGFPPNRVRHGVQVRPIRGPSPGQHSISESEFRDSFQLLSLG